MTKRPFVAQAIHALTILLIASTAWADGPNLRDDAYLVADVEPAGIGTRDGSPELVGRFADLALFVSGLDQRHLYRTDGTPEGTWPLSGLSNATPRLIGQTATHAFMVFPVAASDELWVTDGSPAGTLRLFEQLGQVDFLGTVGSRAVLSIAQLTGPARPQPWTSDGTADGTMLLATIQSTPQATTTGEAVYFGARGIGKGFELWRTDGTPAGTRLLKDIHPGPQGSLPQDFSPLGNGQFVFTASDPARGRELWSSDGTSSGTARITDLASGKASAIISGLAFDEATRFAYFLVGPPTSARLWRTNGTASGTLALSPPGASRALTTVLAGIGRRAIFRLVTTATGDEPWVTDGTPAGTRLLRDICPGSCSGGFTNPVVLAGRLYFKAQLGQTQIWSTNGTRAGTQALSCFEGCFTNHQGDMIGVGNSLLLRASRGGPNVDLYGIQPTLARSTLLLANLPSAALVQPPLLALPARALFVHRDQRGSEPWVTDGTAEHTTLLVDSEPTPLIGLGSEPSWFLATQAGVAFIARTAAQPAALWISDGTSLGTTSVVTPQQGTINFVALHSNGQFAFYGHSYLDAFSLDIWATDGSDGGTQRVLTNNVSSSPFGFLSATTGAIDDDLVILRDGIWRSNGTVEGTREITRNVGVVGEAARFGPLVIFGGSDLGGDTGLWRFDSVDESVIRVDSRVASFSCPASFADRALFVARRDGINDIWTSNGTDSETSSLGAAQSCPVSLSHNTYSANNRIFALTDNHAQPLLLWVPSGTEQAAPVESSGTLGGFVVRAVAGADTGTLWITDGTTAQTRSVATDVRSDQLAWLGDRLYYIRAVGNGTDTLWSTDGSAAGTRQEALLPTDHKPTELYPLSSHLLIAAELLPDGRPTLWTTDGTHAGTSRRAVDLNFELFSVYLTETPDALYLRADDGLHGYEPWAIPLP